MMSRDGENSEAGVCRSHLPCDQLGQLRQRFLKRGPAKAFGKALFHPREDATLIDAKYVNYGTDPILLPSGAPRAGCRTGCAPGCRARCRRRGWASHPTLKHGLPSSIGGWPRWRRNQLMLSKLCWSSSSMASFWMRWCSLSRAISLLSAACWRWYLAGLRFHDGHLRRFSRKRYKSSSEWNICP